MSQGFVVLADASQTVLTGSVLLAIPFALAAGVISFFSPCVLPLVPAYLSYVTGLTGVQLEEASAGSRRRSIDHRAAAGAATGTLTETTRTDVADQPEGSKALRSRILVGTALFVGGFTAVFVSYGALFGGLGSALQQYSEPITRVLGVVTIVLGLIFMGLIPALQREARLHVRPGVGLAAAPLLGIVFGIGWTPCIGPTLGAVQTLAYDSATAGRGALLSLVYCIGLGLPFLITGLAYGRAMGAFGWVRRHYVWVMRIGGGMLVVLGVLLVTGAWQSMSINLLSWVSSFAPAL